MNQSERLVPGGGLEPTFPLLADSLQRLPQAVRAMDKFRVITGHLGADGTMGDGIDFRPAHGQHAIVGNRDRETAGIRAVEWAHARLLRSHCGLIHGKRSRSTLPPDRITPADLPDSGTRPASTAASATALLGSMTILSVSHARRIALTIDSSDTVTISST